MSDEQMTQEQQEAVDRLAGTDSPPSDSTSQDSRVSTADLASAGDRQQQETAQPQQTVGSTDERAKSEAPVGIQSRDTSGQSSPAQAETADAERTPVMSADAAEEYRDCRSGCGRAVRRRSRGSRVRAERRTAV